MEDNRLDLRRYAIMLWRWLWLMILCALVAAVVAFIVSSGSAPVFRATVVMFVNQTNIGGGSEYSDLLVSERLANTYREMLVGRPVMEAVIAELGLLTGPEALARTISIESAADSQLIRLSADSNSPEEAASVANAVGTVFSAQIRQLQESRGRDVLSATEQQLNELSMLIDETQRAIDELNVLESDKDVNELARLQIVLAGYQGAYSSLLRTYEQVRMTASLSMQDIVVYEEARVPDRPIGPRTLLNTVLAGMVGAMSGAGAAFMIEYLDDTLRTSDDVQRSTGLSTLGTIGRMSGAEGDLITLADPLSPLSEAYRSLRTNIRFASLDRPLRTILVTSAGPTEGKSTVTANLAVSMAQSGLRVVAVGADLRRPRLSEIFEVEPRDGLIGAMLTGSTDGHLTPVPNPEGLAILPAGATLPANPAELLGSKRMSEILALLAEQCDVVLVDTPPVLPVTDAVLLSPVVDGVLVVVEVGNTRRAAAREAVNSLRAVGANVIGAVLNGAPVATSGYYYYYRKDETGRESRRRRTGRAVGSAVQGLLRRVTNGRLGQERG